jgi:hypothetical protein
MPAKTLAALKGSIKHWEDNVAAEVGDGSTRWQDCKLCLLFNPYEEEGPENCRGCPVMAQTGKRYCEDSPYHEAWTANVFKDETRWKAAALAELNFLRSLLPDEEKVTDNG